MSEGPLASADLQRDARRVIAAWQEYEHEMKDCLTGPNYDVEKINSAWDRMRAKKQPK